MDEKIKVTNKCPICGRPTHKESKCCIFHASAEEKTKREFKDALKEYVSKIKKENGDYDFSEFIFVGDIDFKKDLNITILKRANFKEANFELGADFAKATFKGNAEFWGTTFEGDANFCDATFEGDANFWGATFKGDAEFWGATFKGNAEFRDVTFEGDAEFGDAIFKGDANFWCVTFEVNAEFWGAIFEKDASFCESTIEGNAKFGEPRIKVNADFLRAIFEGGADFGEPTFEGGANFGEPTFKGGADFRNITFKRNADFSRANFEKYAYFMNATFGGYANFTEVTFKENANFDGVTFKGDVDFRLEYLVEQLYFSGIKATSGKKIFIRLTNKGGKVLFKRAYLENTYLDIELVEGVFIDFNDASLRNTKMEKDKIENHILQEKEKKFSKAQKIYLLLKNNFHSIGRYRDESWAFTKERDMERMSKSFCSLLSKYKKYSLFKKILKKRNLLKRGIVKLKIIKKWLFSKNAIECFNLSVANFIYQYGENPWRVIRFALIIIFSFALLLNFSGIVYSDRTNLLIEFVKENQGDGYTLRYLGTVMGSFLNCLYFSVVTFTTLGYGDFQPAVGLSRFFVSLESIIGAFTMALFVYTFARRTGGK